MKFIIALFATLFLAAPAFAVDVQMGYEGNLVFEPSEVTISAGESVHFVNNMLPPHNVIVEDRPDLGHESWQCYQEKSLTLFSMTLVTILTGVRPTKVLA